ncbi:hypothetical protein DFR86_09380 [Acidianus sulfidivorans JP7]|uniref:ArsA HSP20-like domain-containing protein n=1 Tax=Acidianus sulfidivorans JP7 TaxID=619593 RepID=A0A2U9INZ4_9CREN|nr:hypothetical protein [Acidianus sulfidivorans]AWR97735.1 hypothetical protein DFR86_09380 [Acidianus sulfidivorans JP7]
MPAYKDLHEMIKEMIDREEERIDKEIEQIKEEIAKEAEEPLYTFYEKNDAIYYIIDVPFINEKTIYVKVENKYIKLSCKDIHDKNYQLVIPVYANFENYDIQVIRSKGFIKLVLRKK